jgi:hypothetical protein
MFAIGVVTLGLLAVGCQKPPPPPPAPVPGPFTEQERIDAVGMAGEDGPIVRYDERGSYRRPVEPVQPSTPRYTEPPAVRPGPAPLPPAPLPPPPPIVQEELPEQQAFVRAYRGIGAPKLAVVVYRTADPADPFRNAPNAPAPAAGPLAERAIDYRALELSLADWLASSGQVAIRSSTQLPAAPRPEDVAALREGNPAAADAVRQNTGIDVLVVVWAEITRHTPGGLDIRLVSEAIYLSDAAGQGRRRGDSIGRTFVDMPPRMQADTLAVTTRQIARELMLDMSRTWDDWLTRP